MSQTKEKTDPLKKTEVFLSKLRKRHIECRANESCPEEVEENNKQDDLITLAEIGLRTLKKRAAAEASV